MKQQTTRTRGDLQQEAEQFIQTCYEELGKSIEETEERLGEVRRELELTGSYTHTAEELERGAKMAWRNSNRCIGRLFWDTLEVRDARSAAGEDEVAEELLRHIEFGTNGGRVRPAITIFRASTDPKERLRIWNYQLIRYAGYERDGRVVGDPDSLELTRLCQRLGWSGEGTAYDVLPLLIQRGDREIRWFEIPPSLVLEVPLRHPEFPWFGELGLKWYAVPFVSNMRLEIGGISYSAAPFNGWYMGTEIGARNLADVSRYNMLPRIAERMELRTDSEATLWRDKALVELNVAVLYSYRQSEVSIVDHHTAAKQFMAFEEKEKKVGRPVTGDWTWLIPPLSPATTPIFHRPFDNRTVTPNFFYQKRLPDGF